MSQHNSQPPNQYGSAHSPSRTERLTRERQMQRSPDRIEGARTQRNAVIQSPTKYDIQFYQRKVSRLENDMAVLQDELSLTKFKLTKAEDYQRKYEIAFEENQNLNTELDIKEEENVKNLRKIEELLRKNDQAQFEIQNITDKLTNEKRNNNQLKDRHQQISYKASNQGKNEKASIEDNYLRQIANLKQQFKSKQQNTKRKILSLQNELETQSNNEKALRFKFESIKTQKNKEIDRLKLLSQSLKKQLSELNNSTDARVVKIRTQLIENTQLRIENIRKLTTDVEQCLMSQIRNLNLTLSTKNDEIQFILAADKKFMQDNETIQNGLKSHIKQLQDKIFMIQRQSEIELFQTIDRLQTQYQNNLNSLNDEFDQVRKTHEEQVEQLNNKIKALEKENQLLGVENKRVQGEHKRVSLNKEDAIKMLSQKIISLQSEKDLDLKHYTTSMKEIELDAKAKLEDLHTAIESKNTQFEILSAQLALKNQEISSLIDQINKLRSQNREKMRNLQIKNATEQNSLSDLINNYKKEIQELQRYAHGLQSQMSDREAQSDLKINLSRQDLESQKQANQMLISRNAFLQEWCVELERDLKSERVSNVNILQDTNISRRETVQTREAVRVELQAIKDKELEQMRNIFKLEKNRLEADLLNREHQLREKKEENIRLLTQYKKLQNKVGKPSKHDRGAEEEGKCRATLNAEILLTQNIFNAINTQ